MESNITAVNPRWPLWRKWGALLLMAYLFFSIFPFPFDNLPLLDVPAEAYRGQLNALNLWVGKHLLGMAGLEQIEMTGSGDTTFDYVMLLTHLLLTVVTAFLAWVFTFKKRNYATAYATVIVLVRYYVGLYMIIYGLSKIIEPTQFPAPGYGRLEGTYGDSSPMGLLWTFMGYSPTYSAFGGLMEILGGVLLLFRRTLVLGCIISMAVMGNVFLLNLCYDVPVKIFSGHLLLCTLIILAPYLPKLYAFFIGRRPVQLHIPRPQLPKKWMRVSLVGAKALLLLGVLYAFTEESYEDTSVTTYDGHYETEHFIRNGDTLAAGNDSTRWESMTLEWGYARVKYGSGSRLYYEAIADTAARQVKLGGYVEGIDSILFICEPLDSNRYRFSGPEGDDSLSITFRRKSLKDYPLLKRGFHWVNEYPYNR